MAFSSSLFISSNFTINQHPQSSSSQSTSFKYQKPMSATFATSERTTSTSTRDNTASSLYEVLGIQIGADMVEIKAAYRKLARVLHPDVGKMDSDPDEFIKLHSAYVTLSDPGKRADYDRSLFVRRNVAVRSSSQVGFSGRRWETDQCW